MGNSNLLHTRVYLFSMYQKKYSNRDHHLGVIQSPPKLRKAISHAIFCNMRQVSNDSYLKYVNVYK